MNLIEKLGLEGCHRIVDGAPEWAESFNVYLAAYGSGGIPCKGDVLISDLRAAIANHTDNFSHFDHCTDIRNHISPNTVVIER